MTELELKKPITAHNETLHVLEMREPTYDEIETLGFPFSISSEGGVKMDSQVALKYIPLLAGIPRSSAAQMAKPDIFRAGMIVMRFFTGSETDGTSGSGSTMLRGSGN
ncbi:putative bacteriophage protein [Escherichia coli M056]|uniref:phage tail assembly protein n=1 Tax=Escherichia coli TaxID=562 RepID=UPI000A1860D7|nr:putative bacteriophage protein [Escherichia coli M056]